MRDSARVNPAARMCEATGSKCITPKCIRQNFCGQIREGDPTIALSVQLYRPMAELYNEWAYRNPETTWDEAEGKTT